MACFHLLRSGYMGTIRKSYVYTIWKRSYCICIVFYYYGMCPYTLIVTSYYAYV